MNPSRAAAVRAILVTYQAAALVALCAVYSAPFTNGPAPEKTRDQDMGRAVYWISAAYAQIMAHPDLGGGDFVAWLRDGIRHLVAVGQIRNSLWLARICHDLEWRLGFASEGMMDATPVPESLDLPADPEPIAASPVEAQAAA